VAAKKESYISFKPEKVIGISGSPDGFQLVVDTKSGTIVKTGEGREVGGWLESEKARKDIEVEEITCGALLPGLTDGHNHTLVYATFELLNAVSMLGCADETEALKRIRTAATRSKDTAKPILAVAFDSSKVRSLTNRDLDEVTDGRSVFMLDVSLHSGIASSRMCAAVEAAAAMYDRPLVGELRENGFLTEEYTMRALEIAEADYPLDSIAAAIERKLNSYFEKGITAVHDLMPATVNQFIGALVLRKRWNAERSFDFPITKFYLNKLQIADVVKRMPDLESEGLLSSGEFVELVGVKMFADGAFGSRTAKVSEPYKDTGTTGMYFQSLEDMGEDVATAMRNGMKHGAIHAIGDLGIKRANIIAEKWAKKAAGQGIPMDLRIEHYALPLPREQTLADTEATGAWLCIQPNFLLDYAYEDRLGGRIRTMCQHHHVLNSGIKTFFGTDGMPDSVLFAIWLATHAVEPSQRLPLDAALSASCESAPRFERDPRGALRQGFKADLIAADEKLIDVLTLSGEPDGSMSLMKMFELEGHIKKVFKNGVQVYPKKKN